MAARKLMTLALLTLTSQMIWAATDTWNGSTSEWTTASNWSPAAVPSSGNSLIFPSFFGNTSVDYTNISSSANTFPSITFQASNYQLSSSGSTPLIFSGSPATLANGAFSTLILGPIEIDSPLTINQQSTGSLIIVDMGNFSGTGDLTINASGGLISISGNNPTYSGDITLVSGTLQVSDTSPLGS